MTDAAARLEAVRARIRAACAAAGRAPESVELVAVSKTFPAEAVREVFEAGQRVFGESRQQEAATKIPVLPGAIRWHFIGRVQRNKVRKLLPDFEVIHAVDSVRLAAHINEVAAELGLFPKVFLQVNVSGEETKGGFEPAALDAALPEMLGLNRLEILGLMTIPPEGPDAESARPWFVRLRELRDALEARHAAALPGLSMGMSGDFEVAIAEGATHVRVGSLIFGARQGRIAGELG
jgi:hypothetical protein